MGARSFVGPSPSGNYFVVAKVGLGVQGLETEGLSKGV